LTNPKLDAALDAASRGFRVFPISPGSKKPPKDFPWKERATTDAATIRGWWTEAPDSNIGIAAGHGLLVVDADTKDGKPGLDSLDMLDMLGLPAGLRVATPSGGVHVYLAAGSHRNRVGSVPGHPGIDIRSDGGYVLGPGSVVDGKPYRILVDTHAIDASPTWFDELLRADAPEHMPKSEQPLVELDRPENIARASAWLANAAPEAIEGAGGDDATYRVAAKLRDLGLSEASAVDLMLEHWNEDKASPPWQPDELAGKVENAFRYASGGWGAATAAGEFGAIDIGDVGVAPTIEVGNPTTEPPQGPIRARQYAFTDPSLIPPRQWLYGRHLARKFVSVTVAPGGLGKSSLVIGEWLAMATGKNLLGAGEHAPLTVWYWNLEDPYDELQRRVQAAIQHYGLTADDIGDRLYVDSGRDMALRLAILDKNSGARIVRPVADSLVAEMQRLGIDALAVDPFVSSHAVPENDTNGMDAVVKEWGRIADRADVAIELVHHTRKMGSTEAETTVESARGAKALTDAARDTRVLNRMARDEGEKAGVDNHRLYFRTYSDKANMAPPADRSDWFKLESVALANGDDVGVVVPWDWPDPFAEVTAEHVKRVQAAVAEGEYRESVLSKEWVGHLVAEIVGLDVTIPSEKEKVKKMVREWIEKRWLKVRRVRDEKGKERPVVDVGKPLQENDCEPVAVDE